jgi:hypothetical protein
MSLIDPTTGEVAADADILSVAFDYLLTADAIEQRSAEQKADRARLAELERQLLEVMPPSGVLETEAGDLVRTPAPRPAQRVSRSGCERFAEQLHGLGLGAYVFAPPGIADVRRNAARILAAGIDLEAIAPTPSPGPDTLQIVPKPRL